ncbi:hypothetical protein CK203_110021 [Vitis vinifera]|uniref:UBN2 domain-containing protein n=1 Tax=Vitis vinifera TaxID=29760 RepID=A0A438FEV0_VITVI|nr:hypothetical protein CK203_110021 [Vitis vinifera]
MVLKPRERLQGIRRDNEDLEVTSIKVAYKGHRNSRSKDLIKLPLEDLIGSLMTYEINLANKQQEGEDKKKKSITLKATTKEKEEVEEEKQSEENEDLALIIRKFNKFMRDESQEEKKKAMMGTWSESEESSEEENEKEVANMCFMTIDELDEVNSNLSDEDIHDAFEELYEDLKNLV